MECRHPPAAVTTMTDAFFRGPTMFQFRGQQSGLLKVRVKASSLCLVGHDRTESVARNRLCLFVLSPPQAQARAWSP